MFGTGSIRGFAITLGLGVILSMLTAISLTRYLLKWLIASKIFESPAIYGATGFLLFDPNKINQKAVK